MRERKHLKPEILERINDGVFALDEEWRFTYLNERAAELIDVDRERIVGEDIWAEFEEAVETTFEEEYRRAMETQEPVSFEEYYPPLDSWFEVRAYPSETGLSVYFRDVSDRVERARELERFETIFETVDDGIYTVDDGVFTMVNDAYAEMVGYDREELVGAPVTEVVDESVAERAAELERKLGAGEESVTSMDGVIERRDGTTIEAEATFKLLPGGERLAVVKDVTRDREREEELGRLQELLKQAERIADVGGWEIDVETEEVFWTENLFELIGAGYDEAPSLDGALDVYVAEDRDRVEAAVEEGIENGEPFDVEARIETPDGEIRWLRVRGEPKFEDGEMRMLRGTVRDITERKAREQQLHRRIEQQDIVTRLGKRGLENRDVDTLMEEATRLVAEALDADYCKVLDLDAEDATLLLRQGVGWDDGYVGAERVSAVDDDSQAAYTLSAAEPVVVKDFETEERFSGPPLLRKHDVRSGISTIIGSPDDPWGVLGVHATAARSFSDQDVNFVQSVANVLGSAIRRHEDETALRRQHERIKALNDINSLVHDLAESVFGRSSIAEIERLVCDRLAASDSYLMAWMSEPEPADGELVVSSEAGVSGYLDDVTLSLDRPPGERGPTVAAHLTGEMQVVQNVQTDERYERWRDHARELGYSASASIPVVDGDRQHGTLNVYSDRQEAFGDEERTALQRLGTVVAYAVEFVERDRQLQRERDRIEFMNRLLRHNLLNDLNVVSARLDLLDGRVDYEVSDHLQTAADRTDEMIEFVETVRDVTKVIGRGDEQELEPVPLDDVLEDRVERTRQFASEATVHLESAPPVDVVADDLLGEVLDNVLVNAVQHNDTDTPTVWVDATVTDEEVDVAVADDGPGVQDEQKRKIFEREAMDFEDPGTGFGLYLVREVLRSYGGEITVADSDRGGARFELTFQRA